MAVRSAEASRNATCSFADRVAELSVAFYKKHCPNDLLEAFNQTVLATLAVQIDGDALSIDLGAPKTILQVVSMGVGTKVVPAETIASHRSEARAAGDRLVRDSHAEVLARRGFVQYLYNQIQMRIKLNATTMSDEGCCIFQPTSIRDKFVLKPGVCFHLYTSSQPCGNASIKRWAKVKPLRFQEAFSADTYPLEPHARIQITPESRREGQVALLVKRNRAARPAPSERDNTSAEPNMNMKMKTEDISSEHVPVGTALPSSGEGNVMTCSDKIALWNALGLQGALLTAFMQPVYLSTITVGRKFSQVHCQRALCCRLQDFCHPAGAGGSKKGAKKRKQEKQDTVPLLTATLDAAAAPAAAFEIHHPAMLGTQVKLDEGSIVTGAAAAAKSGTGTDGEEAPRLPAAPADAEHIAPPSILPSGGVGSALRAEVVVGARFDEPRCVVGYASYAQDPNGTSARTEPLNYVYVVEVLDGRTGLLSSTEGGIVGSDGIDSAVSSCSMMGLFKSTSRLFASSTNTQAALDVPTAEESYAEHKRRVASEYSAAKDALFSDPLTFGNWVRKC